MSICTKDTLYCEKLRSLGESQSTISYYVLLYSWTCRATVCRHAEGRSSWTDINSKAKNCSIRGTLSHSISLLTQHFIVQNPSQSHHLLNSALTLCSFHCTYIYIYAHASAIVSTNSFQQVRTRAITLQKYTCSTEDILKYACKLLKPELPVSLRLIGIVWLCCIAFSFVLWLRSLYCLSIHQFDSLYSGRMNNKVQ